MPLALLQAMADKSFEQLKWEEQQDRERKAKEMEASCM